MNNRDWRFVLYAISVFRILFTVGLCGFYLILSLYLGRFPLTSGFDDPKQYVALYTIFGPMILTVSVMTGFTWPFFLLVSLVHIIYNRLQDLLWGTIAITAAFHIAAHFLMSSELLRWFADN